jgi:hypothetical protein
MGKHTILTFVTASALLTLGRFPEAQTQRSITDGNQVTVPFSDPGRPGTVRLNLLSGSISVKAGSSRDVIVTVNREDSGRDDRQRERERARQRERERQNDQANSGLRRLTQPAGVNVEEENNTVTISSPVLNGAVDIDIQVPAATSLVLRSVNGGEVSVERVNGSIEVNNVNGDIRLVDVGGPVIAHATNGRVEATLRQIAAGKPMAFTSFNGDVDVTLPASAKANLKMRSDRGDVYTDFDVTTTQAPRTQPNDRNNNNNNNNRNRDRDDRPRYRLEMDRSIYGTVNGGGPDFELRTFNGDIYLRKAK